MDLQEKLSNVPPKPGVYLMKSVEGKILYIGKAKALRSRVKSYFQEFKEGAPRQAAMISKIADFEYIVTDSDVEALILEANLVRQHKPKYNVNLKDDKRFPYIKVTREAFPQVFATRILEKDGSRYFGPYTEVKQMKALLRTLKRIFPVRSCKGKLPSPEEGRSCLYHHIGRCLAPCLGEVGEKGYNELIEQVCQFLSGRSSALMADLKGKMKAAVEELRFEEAAKIRDQLSYVERISMKQKVVSTEPIDRDVLAVAVEKGDACGVILQVRDGKLIGRERYHLNGVKGRSESEVMAGFVKQHYLSVPFIPGQLHLQYGVEDAAAIEQWLNGKKGSKVQISVPKRGEKAKLVQMAARNAKLLLEELHLERLKQKERLPQAIVSLQRELRLKQPPRRIEAFDVSNIQGADAVGSVVCFRDGRPVKGEYRRFKIRTVEGQDDYGMLQEVVGRRYSRLLEEGKPLPDLILIDGGKGQLSSAIDKLKSLGIDGLDVIGLAKRLDEVYLPGIPDPQMISKVSPVLRLLQRVRDEAHRFAVEYHRKLRQRRAVCSELDEVPGVGEKRRKALLSRFGSLKGVKEATVEDLVQVSGISRGVAEQIYDHFHPEGFEPVEEG